MHCFGVDVLRLELRIALLSWCRLTIKTIQIVAMPQEKILVAISIFVLTLPQILLLLARCPSSDRNHFFPFSFLLTPNLFYLPNPLTNPIELCMIGKSILYAHRKYGMGRHFSTSVSKFDCKNYASNSKASKRDHGNTTVFGILIGSPTIISKL